jgi:hypothetical protein
VVSLTFSKVVAIHSNYSGVQTDQFKDDLIILFFLTGAKFDMKAEFSSFFQVKQHRSLS